MALIAVLDTNAVILLLQGGAKLPAASQVGRFVVSVITEIELLGWSALKAEEERAIRSFLEELEILPLTAPVKDAAIQLRRAHRLKTPDAVIAATASVLGAMLVTNDSRLLALPSIEGVPLSP